MYKYCNSNSISSLKTSLISVQSNAECEFKSEDEDVTCEKIASFAKSMSTDKSIQVIKTNQIYFECTTPRRLQRLGRRQQDYRIKKE